MVVYCAQLETVRLLCSKLANEIKIERWFVHTQMLRQRAKVYQNRRRRPKMKKSSRMERWSVLSPPEVQFSFRPSIDLQAVSNLPPPSANPSSDSTPSASASYSSYSLLLNLRGPFSVLTVHSICDNALLPVQGHALRPEDVLVPNVHVEVGNKHTITQTTSHTPGLRNRPAVLTALHQIPHP